MGLHLVENNKPAASVVIGTLRDMATKSKYSVVSVHRDGSFTVLNARNSVQLKLSNEVTDVNIKA